MVQCPNHQLLNSNACRRCIELNTQYSGALHRLDRVLSGVGTAEYEAVLRRTLKTAAGVLVLNPLIADLLRPHCSRVEVVPWGMDPERFPDPTPRQHAEEQKLRILFAGLPTEPIKGFSVLHAACARLWSERQDFELLVTRDEMPEHSPFVRCLGWQSQADLPAVYRECDILAVPTIAQDGLSRTAVEAMASARPVLASRIGGLPWVVADGETGLLATPGNVADWASQLRRLLDDAALRQHMGRQGRAVFEKRFRWPDVIVRHYGRLFGPPFRTSAPNASETLATTSTD